RRRRPEARLDAKRRRGGRRAYVRASEGHPGTATHPLAGGVAPAAAARASPIQAWQLIDANPRFLLRYGLPAGASVPARAWRARPEARVSAARVAARRLGARYGGFGYCAPLGRGLWSRPGRIALRETSLVCARCRVATRQVR